MKILAPSFFRISKSTLAGVSIGLILWLSVLLLGGIFQLADRSRYLAGGSISDFHFDRTSFADLIFGLSPVVEPVFVCINILLLLALCRKLILVYSLHKSQVLILYAIGFAPFRLLFRSYASKELLFSITTASIIIYFLSRSILVVKSSNKLGVYRSSTFHVVPLLLILFLVSAVIRPFYAVLLLIPSILLLPSGFISSHSRKLLLLAIALLGSISLFFIIYHPYFYELLINMMHGYFLIDGRDASSTRLDYILPASSSEFLVSFIASIHQSLLGPFVHEVFQRPHLIFVYAEGLFFVFVFLLMIRNTFSFKSGVYLSSRLSSVLLISLLYLLFVFYIFSAINYMGGIRFQSSSVPILLLLYSLSCSILNSKQFQPS
jgi:hypothetical protein